MLLKARWIIPITTPPIENGWIRIENGVIVEMGQGQPPNNVGADLCVCPNRMGAHSGAPLHNFCNTALFPGLINAHAHLEFDREDHPRDSFAKWVQSLQRSQERNSAGAWHKNLHRLIETGTTTIVNHCNQIPPETTAKEPHMIHICEIVGSSPERGAESYREACQMRLELLNVGARSPRPGGETPPLQIDAVISPTSLYAVSPVVWEQFLEQRDRAELVSIHIKESEEEDLLYKKGQGSLTSFIKKRGGQIWLSDPVGWLKNKEILGPKTLLVHGNYLNDSDLDALQGTGGSVIHCPGSHKYFGHQRFPLESIRERAINIALGTDSLASNEDLSMLREMRLLKENYPELSLEDIATMATLNGAKALGDEANCGSLEPGKHADLIAVPCESQEPYEALLRAEKVAMTMVRGNVI